MQGMEESQEILVRSLKTLGLQIPPQISSVKGLDSPVFFSICSQSLHLLLRNPNTSSFPTSLPDPMAEKVKICTDMASAFRKLGYPSEISFHQFLYPSEEDLHKLVRFLVERLSELSEASNTSKSADNVRQKTLEGDAQSISRTWPDYAAAIEVDLNNMKVRAKQLDVGSDAEAPVSSDELVSDKLVEAATTNTSFTMLCTTKDTTGKVDNRETLAYSGDLERKTSHTEETATASDLAKPEQGSVPCAESSPELRCKLENMCNQETTEATGKDLELHRLEEEHELLKEAVRMALDNEHSVSFHIEQLNEQIAARRCNLQEMKNEWDVTKKPLEEEKWNLLESFCASNREGQHKLQKLKEIEMEMHSVLCEIRKREEECAKLSSDLEKKPKFTSRRSYIQRITEITKNSRKLDADIERILKETRELKLESNSIEERLHRTYAVVDEMLFREAKKDSVGRQAYRLLTSIHESFKEICEQILAADKAQREVAELEVKLSAIASRSLDMDKLLADLDAMRRENEHLEKALQNH